MSVSSDIETTMIDDKASEWDDDIVSCLTHYAEWVKFERLMEDLEVPLDKETPFIKALNGLILKGTIRVRTDKKKTSKMYRINA